MKCEFVHSSARSNVCQVATSNIQWLHASHISKTKMYRIELNTGILLLFFLSVYLFMCQIYKNMYLLSGTVVQCWFLALPVYMQNFLQLLWIFWWYYIINIMKSLVLRIVLNSWTICSWRYSQSGEPRLWAFWRCSFYIYNCGMYLFPRNLFTCGMFQLSLKIVFWIEGTVVTTPRHFMLWQHARSGSDNAPKPIHSHAQRYRDSNIRELFNVNNLHNDCFNIKRLIPYSFMTFCSLNIHHPGFGELNLLYEYEVIEKCIASSSQKPDIN